MFMRVPKKLQIVPILEALFEIRFESNTPEDTNIGIIYNEFKNDFGLPSNLPLMNIPMDVRSKDPNFRYQAYQRLASKDGKFLLQYGQRTISLHCVNYKYDVFQSYQDKINDLIERLDKLQIVTSVNRIGLRYIDFLTDSEIPGYKFSDLNLNINIAGMGFGDNFSCSTEFKAHNSSHRTQIFKMIQIQHEGNSKQGDMIDIDSFTTKEIKDLKSIKAIVPDIHEEQKKIFFGIMGEKVTALLGPTYE